ncbi:MAG TPA: SgcJ/EcaC family oxidoreductase [Edaphobacter sp.]|nr:SgcJ/EcaC family oxidoreductase [Edaphobacter sp.]
MSQPTDERRQQTTESDQQQIRALIDAWCEASSAGDLTAQFQLMTHDVVFLTSGRAPMRRDEFATAFRAMMEIATIHCRSRLQEITVSGDLAVCWNLLEVSFTPVEGGEVRKHAGNVLTALRRGDDGQWRIWRDANLLTPA